MKILVRADSSFLIGTGHIIRCLTLGFYLKKLGKNVIFVCRDLEGNIISLVEEKQFKVTRLSPPNSLENGSQYDQMRGVPLSLEINEMKTIIDQEKPDWVIVDHYGLSDEWEKSIRHQGVKLFAIDDILRTHSCDALLDQNYGQDHSLGFQNYLESKTKLFLGQQYVLLHPTFSEITVPKRSFGTVKSVLVFFGGSDHTGETVKFLQGINSQFDSYQFDIVVGKNSVRLKEIKELCQGKTHIRLHVQTNEMAKLMAKADLFVGAGGTATWERSYMGLPAICISIADNQINGCQHLHDIQAHLYLGKTQDIKAQDYALALKKLIGDPQLRRLYSENSLALNVGSKTQEIVNYFN